jgi:hypothetical protein
LRALHLSLAVNVWLVAASAAADEWRVGFGPEVFAEPDDAPATRVGGWLDASYEGNDLGHSTGGLNHVIGYVDTRWRSFQAFIEAEYERETDLSGYEAEHQLELEQAYLRWQSSDAFGVRAGRFNTPFGWWVPIHWSILMDSLTPPLYVGNEVIPEQQIGVELAGRIFPRDIAGLDSELSWSLFSGYGGESLDTDRTDGLSVGGDLRLRLAERFLLGTSLYRQKNAELENRSELNGVVYGEAPLPCKLTLRSEYVYSHRDRVGGMSRNADSVYAALRWDAHEMLYLAYRFGYGEDDDEEALTTDERAAHTMTLGILPRPDVRLKLEYSHNELKGGTRPDFDYWAVSLGYLF